MKISLSNNVIFFIVIGCMSYAQVSYAACSGGSVANATPPSPSAALALDLLKNKPEVPTAAKPKEKLPVVPVVTPVPTPPTTVPTPTPVTPPAPPIVATAPSTAVKPPMAGKVVWVTGTLKVVGADKKVRILQAGSLIYPEDSIVTDAKSKAQVVFTDDSIVTFNNNTVFNVTKYEYKPDSTTASAGKYVMNLVEGSFRTVTGKIPKKNSFDYQVNTPIAAIGVRGTGYAAAFGGCRVDVKHYTGKPVLETAKGSIVLTGSSPFAAVTGPNMAPITVKVEPAIFKNTLPIVPATVDSIPTMPDIISKINDATGGGGGGGVCTPGSGGGGAGFTVKFQ